MHPSILQTSQSLRAAPHSRFVWDGWRTWDLLRGSCAFLISLAVHLALLLTLAFVAFRASRNDDRFSLVLAGDDLAIAPEPMQWETPHELQVEVEREDAEVASRVAALPAPPSVHVPFSQPVSAGTRARPSDQARTLPSHELLLLSAGPSGGGIEGRSADRRAQLVAEFGGTAASERAVEAGLQWLAAHQRPDGSWRLKHVFAQCDCTHEGHGETAIGATGLALLPFLGAGYTQRQGPYQNVVQRGLDYLCQRLLATADGGSLAEGATYGMYTHGIATVALCEAYAMTQDPSLRGPAEQAVQFICSVQHSRGGWRYNPGQPGDTTVTGWQVMALQSARMAGLETPPEVLERAGEFLDSVATPQECFFGYQSPRKEPGPTSVALLLRMYLGWPRTDHRLERGALYLATIGPSETDMYFNYYATQVLHHQAGTHWPKWNERLRDYLVSTQAGRGHEKGSWYFPDRHGTIGGRLYTTAMCLMILEVYYRHMPLYGDGALGKGLF